MSGRRASVAAASMHRILRILVLVFICRRTSLRHKAASLQALPSLAMGLLLRLWDVRRVVWIRLGWWWNGLPDGAHASARPSLWGCFLEFRSLLTILWRRITRKPDTAYEAVHSILRRIALKTVHDRADLPPTRLELAQLDASELERVRQGVAPSALQGLPLNEMCGYDMFRGHTLLTLASELGELDCVRALLALGASPAPRPSEELPWAPHAQPHARSQARLLPCERGAATVALCAGHEALMHELTLTLTLNPHAQPSPSTLTLTLTLNLHPRTHPHPHPLPKPSPSLSP